MPHSAFASFVIPDEVSNSAHTGRKKLMSQILSKPPVLSAPLLLFPAELLLMVFDHAAPEDQLCLALTCRHLIQFSRALSLRIPSTTKHRSLPFCPRLDKLLRRLKPLNERGLPKRTLALCCSCLRYRPTRRSYWKAKQIVDASPKVWESVLRGWNSKYSAQCPECWCEEEQVRRTTAVAYRNGPR